MIDGGGNDSTHVTMSSGCCVLKDEISWTSKSVVFPDVSFLYSAKRPLFSDCPLRHEKSRAEKRSNVSFSIILIEFCALLRNENKPKTIYDSCSNERRQRVSYDGVEAKSGFAACYALLVFETRLAQNGYELCSAGTSMLPIKRRASQMLSIFIIPL